jgi:hypothetical protein
VQYAAQPFHTGKMDGWMDEIKETSKRSRVYSVILMCEIVIVIDQGDKVTACGAGEDPGAHTGYYTPCASRRQLKARARTSLKLFQVVRANGGTPAERGPRVKETINRLFY